MIFPSSSHFRSEDLKEAPLGRLKPSASLVIMKLSALVIAAVAGTAVARKPQLSVRQCLVSPKLDA